MPEQLNRRHIAELIVKLRERIMKLDDDHWKAVKLSAYITMSKQETYVYEDRCTRLNELRRELLNLMRSLQ